MEKEPKISVIIPVYNSEELILRALASVPARKNIQLIILDDGSTDDSWRKIVKWSNSNFKRFHKSSTIHRWQSNKGVASAMNLGFNLARGEYIVSLSSDDYYITDFEAFRPYLNGKNDLIYFDLEVNDGSVWHLNNKSKLEFVGAVRFIRREFLGDTRIPNFKYKEDKPFAGLLFAKHPKEVFTGIVLKHYNWPRIGSLSWQATQDYENDHEKWSKNSGQK